MRTFKKKLFYEYKMVVITVQNYTEGKVCTITVGNRELFSVKMTDVQNGLGIEKKSVAFLKLKILHKSKLENINVLKKK